jgi:nitronate monooxygenase
MSLELFGVQLPIIQAPMAGSQGNELAIAVSNAGGLGSLPCAMLSLDAMRTELTAIRAKTGKPFNVNFFCHSPPVPNPTREALWRKLLQPYFDELGISAGDVPGPARAPFSAAAADVLEPFKPREIPAAALTSALTK